MRRFPPFHPPTGIGRAAVLAAGVLLSGLLDGGCSGLRDNAARPAGRAAARPDTTAAHAAPPTPVKPPLPIADMRLEVDVRARRLRVYHHDSITATYPVAVGSPEWPTRPGRWTVVQVVWNPTWIPPEQSWARELERKAPGDPDNPLGRAQLVYDPPRTVHGTNKPHSVGKAVSHGSIRMVNADITRLAREIMEATGAGKDAAWYEHAQADRTVKRIVDLPEVVPISVYGGAAGVAAPGVHDPRPDARPAARRTLSTRP